MKRVHEPSKYRIVGMITKTQLDFIKIFKKQNKFSESKTVRHFIEFYMRSINYKEVK